MKEKYVIGADIGTTVCKSILFTLDGRAVASASRGYKTYAPAPGHVEQDANDWYRTVCETVREITADIPDKSDVLAMCFSTQGGTFVPADAEGRPLRRAFVWSDERATEELKLLNETLGPDYIYTVSGWGGSPGQNALQTLWLRRHEPEIFAKTKRFMSVPDFMSLHLTGRAALDISNGGINQTMDVRKGTWDKKLAEFTGLDSGRLAEQLGDIVESGDVIGTLTEQAAADLGLTTAVKLVAGGHDQYCAVLGAGLTDPGDTLIGSGTAWVVTGIRSAPIVDLERHISFSRHTVKGLWGALISLPSGGASLDWFVSRMLPEGSERPLYSKIDAVCAQRGVKSPRLMMFPYLSRTRFPRNTEKSGMFCGIHTSDDWYDLAAAVMEGVTYHAAMTLETLAGKDLRHITLTGGAAKSAYWSGMVADVTGIPVRVPAITDAGCVGAGILAAESCGLSAHEAVEAFKGEGKVIDPGPGSAAYKAGFEAWRQRLNDTYFS